jgi:hypothetical protein
MEPSPLGPASSEALVLKGMASKGQGAGLASTGWASAGRATGSVPPPAPDEAGAHSPTVDPLFFSVPRVSTLAGERGLTHASGFYFQRDGPLDLVTSRHVVFDQARLRLIGLTPKDAADQLQFLTSKSFRTLWLTRKEVEAHLEDTTNF